MILRRYSPLYLLLLCLISGPKKIFSQQILTDTIYYNYYWQICEAPIASFYRTGVLASAGSFWYFTGEVRDYTIDSILLMEGHYVDSVKNGLFKFYFNNGKVIASGNFKDDQMTGDWHYCYRDGKDRATINFNGNEHDYKFITFKDENGKQLMENGTGGFIWPLSLFMLSDLYITGSQEEGKRSGKWEYRQTNGSNMFNFTEWYDNDGKLIKSRFDISKSNRELEPVYFNFLPGRLQKMEDLSYNSFFKVNGDSLAGKVLYNYLVHHIPTEIIVPDKNFDSAYAVILNVLHNFTTVFDFKSKDVDVDIEFKLGPNGYPEELTMSGTGLSEPEKKFLQFLLPKFSHIDMPGTSTIAVEGYHHIFMYSFDARAYCPISMRNEFGRELMFTEFPRKKFIGRLEEHKKDFRKYFRKILQPHTYGNNPTFPALPQPGEYHDKSLFR